MKRLGIERELVDRKAYEHALARFRELQIRLPTFSELADPGLVPPNLQAALAGVDPDAPHALNLYRTHWYNGPSRTELVHVPDHLLLSSSITGVDAQIAIVLGNRFPMIGAHKVLAAYGCLAPRIVTGQFDPTVHKAVWPSTGNYARGGVAMSRIMGCRGIAVLPEGMSEERFEWLQRWVADPSDIVRTPGTESNVKEIYDRCAELERDPEVIVFNQFCEFGNYLVHYFCTGRALEAVFLSVRGRNPDVNLRAFVSASGSGGTLGAGDYLKEQHGARIVAVEALECPTLLYNGFGEHNIQGIGDKHVPFIHNVMNTDVVTAISDVSTDRLDILFNTDIGREYLVGSRNVSEALVDGLPSLGLSSICNILAAIKTAKYYRMGPDDLIVTVATDGASMYSSGRAGLICKHFPQGFDTPAAAATFAEHVLGIGTDHFLETSLVDRERIFNLGYLTWVEQQGVSLEEFTARRDQTFWTSLRDLVPAWDDLITEFNGRAGLLQ